MDVGRYFRSAADALAAGLTPLRALLVAGVLGLAGACAPTLSVAGFEELPSEVDQHEILAVSARAPTGDATLYGRERAQSLTYGRHTVTIPPEREPGRIRYPRGTPDPMRHFTLAGAEMLDGREAFVGALDRELSQLDEDERILVIFVHGYNETFGSGLFRFAQMMHDFQIPGAPLYFAWASAGDPRFYAYDLDSVLISRDSFADTLRMASSAQTDRIMIIAHSMGSMLTLEALRDLSENGETDVLARIGQVALMSPDISVDVFRSQLDAIAAVSDIDFVVFTSTRDRALQASAALRGQTDRLGSMRSVEAVADLRLTVVDVSGFQTADPLRHSTLTMSPELIALFAGTRDFGVEPAQRAGAVRGPLSLTVNVVRQATEIILAPASAAAGAIEGTGARQ
ncbi:MAG: alpha/beta hydrolase [Caulobacterales bacterium]|uniref:alpha/beta hydrolase n=1 Tax=Glycocaulis sp. TaxID=1969725 RepID=UPI003F9F94B9